MRQDLTTDRQKAIAEIAAQLFRKRGYRETSIRDIAAAAGVKSASLYYHFPTKDHILLAIALKLMEDFAVQVTSVLKTEDDPVHVVTAAVAAHLRFNSARPDEVLVSSRERRSLPPEMQRPVNEVRAQHRRALRAVITAGVDQGRFLVEDSNLAANAVLDMLQGLMEWQHNLNGVSVDTLVARYQVLTLSLLGGADLGRRCPGGD